MITKIASLISLMLSVVWLVKSPDWEPAIASITFFAALIGLEVKSYKDSKKGAKNQNIIEAGINNHADDFEPTKDEVKRKKIIEKYTPALYLPLEKNFCAITKYPSCETGVFPHIFVQGETFENNPFVSGLGYRFNGKNLISVHSKNNFPAGREARTFIFAVKPTTRPKKNKPMFFFSYGQRETHKCRDGKNNHDKSFGVFWGEPNPEQKIKKKFKGIGVRVFFYCEHCKEDRISDNCDTPKIYDINNLNQWQILAVTYDGDRVQLYVDGVKLHDEEYIINTSSTPYLNIGGFVHHNEEGAMIIKDLDYTMNGYIREFLMIRDNLSQNEISDITNELKILIGNNT